MKRFLEDALFTAVFGITSIAVGMAVYLAIQCAGFNLLWEMIGK